MFKRIQHFIHFLMLDENVGFVCSALKVLIMDVFKGQMTDAVKEVLK